MPTKRPPKHLPPTPGCLALLSHHCTALTSTSSEVWNCLGRSARDGASKAASDAFSVMTLAATPQLAAGRQDAHRRSVQCSVYMSLWKHDWHSHQHQRALQSGSRRPGPSNPLEALKAQTLGRSEGRPPLSPDSKSSATAPRQWWLRSPSEQNP